jgi:hypothetical protein
MAKRKDTRTVMRTTMEAKLWEAREAASREGKIEGARDAEARLRTTEITRKHEAVNASSMATFDTGATRDISHDKFDYEGFLSPTVMEAFGAFMHANRQTAIGLRDSDNWQKGIPFDTYMKSMFRHFHAAWKAHRISDHQDSVVVDLLAIMFNAQGYLHEYLKQTGLTGMDVLVLAMKVRDAELKKRAAGQCGSP